MHSSAAVRRLASWLIWLALAGCGRRETPLEVTGVGEVEVVQPAPVQPEPTPQPPSPVEPVNHHPTVELIGTPPLLAVDDTFELEVRAEDEDGDALTFDWRVAGVTRLSSGEAAATFKAVAPGPGWVTLRVLDGHGGVGVATVWLRVAADEPPPPPPPPPAVDAGQPPSACGQPAAWAIPDPARDVTLANADIIGSAASIENGQVDLRVQFCDLPFPLTATHMLDWCLDTDGSTATDNCGYNSGVDNSVAMDNFSRQVRAGSQLFNTCDVASWDAATHTLRVVFPLSALGPNTTMFRYKIGSIFGGSGGANDWTPVSQLSWAMHPLSPTLPPFEGVSLCIARPEHLGP